MGLYLPNVEIPKGGYITLSIYADGSVIKTREFQHGTLRVIAQRMEDAVNMNEQEENKKSA